MLLSVIARLDDSLTIALRGILADRALLAEDAAEESSMLDADRDFL